MPHTGFVGLIAGNGALPVEFAKQAAARDWKVVAIGVTDGVSPQLACLVHEYLAVPITEWGRIVDALLERGIEDVYVLGSVSPQVLYSGAPMDPRFLAVISRAKESTANMLFWAFAQDLADCGITIREQTELLSELTAAPGVLTRRQPTAEETKDIAFGLRMAKGIAALDIGQTVVVKRQAVLAVEAGEGTNETLRRGARLGRGDVVAVKVAKPNQDPRFDMPTIGPDTLTAMIESGVRVLAFEAHRTLLLDKDELIRRAEAHDLTLVAVDPATAGEVASCAS